MGVILIPLSDVGGGVITFGIGGGGDGSYIQVVTPPTKTMYNEGDTIDFTGIVVKRYKKDGTVWEDEDYPGGVVPFSELRFPVTVAHYEEGGE